MIKITVIGSTGRMGRLLLNEINQDPTVELSGALARSGNPFIGQDVGSLIGESPLNIFISDDPKKAFKEADILVEFSRPEVLEDHLQVALTQRKPFLSCITGLDKKQQAALEKASQTIPVLFAPNTSLGIVILKKMSMALAQTLGSSYDISLLEMHHRHKKDAPSGTSLLLGNTLSELEHLQKSTPPYLSESPRPSSQIECSVLRGGGVIGDHSVIFAGEKDMITIEHRTLDRSLYAQGALKAAQWLYKKPPGYYTIDDVVKVSL